MCIAVPMRIEALEGPRAVVNAGGLKRKVNIQLVPEVSVGDYVLVHAGFAIEKVEKNLAEEDLKLWQEMEETQGRSLLKEMF